MEEMSCAWLGSCSQRTQDQSRAVTSPAFFLQPPSEPAQALPFPSHTQVLQVRQSCEGIVSDQCELVGVE